MIRILFIALLAVPLLPISASAYDVIAPRDSVGVERKNGKVFVQHRVEPKETLYALSRKYGVSVSQIVDSNPSVETTINIGQIVLIPRKYAAAPAAIQQTAAAPAASNRTFTVNNRGEKLHQVEPQQTLYSISRMHGVKVDDIKRWNNLPDNTISVGSNLIVGKGQAVASKNPIYVSESDDAIANDKVTDTAVASAEPVPVPTTSPANQHIVLTPQPATPAPATTVAADDDVDEVSGAKKIIQTGMAEMIDPKADTNKYLALHKSAPVGTIMQVKNAMNDQVVYVRVIGKLPDTGASDNVVVRLSKKACQKLGAIDQKFRVELSYMP